MARIISMIQPVGFNKDLPPHTAPLEDWTGGINVHCRDGIPGRILGYEDLFGDPGQPPIWLLPTLTPTIAWWIYGTGPDAADQGLWVTDGASHFDITPAGGVDYSTKQNPFTGTVFNGVPVINWGVADAPVFWDLNSGNIAQDLPGWPANTTVEAMRGFKNYLIGMNVTDTGQNISDTIIWSDSAEPGTLPTEWVPLPSNDAGFLALAAEPGPIVDGITLRNQFLIFKNNSTWTLDFIGGTFIFALRNLFKTTGVLSRNCAAEFQGKVVCFSDGDITISDGHSVDSIVDRRMRRFIFSQISATHFQNSFVAHYSGRREMWFCFPTANSEYADTAAVWDYEQNKWTIRELFGTPFGIQGVVPETGDLSWDSDPNPWDSDSTVWNEANFNPVLDNLVLADPDTGFTAVDQGQSFADGSAITGRFERDSLDFGKPLEVKTIRSVWCQITGTAGDIIDIRIGGQMDIDDPIEWSNTVEFVIGTDRKVDVFATGRFLSFTFQSQGGAQWFHNGFQPEFGTVGSAY